MIRKNENGFTVFLNKRLYDRGSVEKACLKFSDFFKCRINEETDSIILNADTKDENDLLELANYLFAIVKQKGA